MNATSITEFVGAMVVIPMILAFLKSAWPRKKDGSEGEPPGNLIIVLVLAMSLAWGFVLWSAGQVAIGGTHLPDFVIQVLVTAFAASGLREHATTLVPTLSNLALLQEKSPAVSVSMGTTEGTPEGTLSPPSP